MEEKINHYVYVFGVFNVIEREQTDSAESVDGTHLRRSSHEKLQS